MPQDKEKALQWYKKAADQGFGGAEWAIKNMQSNGIGPALAFGAALAVEGVLEKLERLGEIFKG